MQYYKELDSELANCLGTDPDMFFPDAGDRWALGKAQKICAVCDIRMDCLQVALDNDEKEGIWGGAGMTARKKMKKDPAARKEHEREMRKLAKEINKGKKNG
jgi:WhiB family redox-sensing transcriptional regulator